MNTCLRARTIIQGGEKFPELCGQALFFQQKESVLLEISVSGLPRNSSGFFALHIHEGEDCGGEEFADTKAHYNPEKTGHPKHAGDLPPLLSCHGKAYMKVKTDRFTVCEILGKTLVIHNQADDFTTQPAGNAGEKIACGTIQKY